jgi:hypothetical protein
MPVTRLGGKDRKPKSSRSLLKAAFPRMARISLECWVQCCAELAEVDLMEMECAMTKNPRSLDGHCTFYMSYDVEDWLITMGLLSKSIMEDTS